MRRVDADAGVPAPRVGRSALAVVPVHAHHAVPGDGRRLTAPFPRLAEVVVLRVPRACFAVFVAFVVLRRHSDGLDVVVHDLEEALVVWRVRKPPPFHRSVPRGGDKDLLLMSVVVAAHIQQREPGVLVFHPRPHEQRKPVFA